MLQRPASGGFANLLFSTHEAVEGNMKRVLEKIEELGFVASRPVMIRIV